MDWLANISWKDEMPMVSEEIDYLWTVRCIQLDESPALQGSTSHLYPGLGKQHKRFGTNPLSSGSIQGIGVVIEPDTTTELEFIPGIGYSTYSVINCAHNLPRQTTHSSLDLVITYWSGKQIVDQGPLAQ